MEAVVAAFFPRDELRGSVLAAFGLAVTPGTLWLKQSFEVLPRRLFGDDVGAETVGADPTRAPWERSFLPD